MSEQRSQDLAALDVDVQIRRNIKLLLAGNDMKRPAIYRELNLSRQAFSARLSGVTRFTVAEVIRIAKILEVTVELLAGPTEQVVAGQNWKLMMTPDLQWEPVVHALSPHQVKTNGARALLHGLPSLIEP